MLKVSAILITREKKYPIKIEGFDEIIIKTESPSVYQRYLEATKARNEIIYFQDDDAIVDFNELWKHYDGRLTNGTTQHHQSYYKDSGITLVGWGCFFPKKMLSVFSKYIEKYGADEQLFREADRIFTYLNQPHNTIIQKHEDLNQVNRMSHEGNHYSSLTTVLKKLQTIVI